MNFDNPEVNTGQPFDVYVISDEFEQQGYNIHPLIFELFTDNDFVSQIPDNIKNNQPEIARYMFHSSRLFDILNKETEKKFIGETSGLLGESPRIDGSQTGLETENRNQHGPVVNVKYLETLGIDPKYILFFRVTQPQKEEPKLESYWTSDFYETQKGLTREISPDMRKTSITLVASLAEISGDSTLIQDINDDSGLAVQRLSTTPFNQNRSLFVIARNQPD